MFDDKQKSLDPEQQKDFLPMRALTLAPEEKNVPPLVKNERSEILSVPQACEFLAVHRNTLYKLISEGEIPAFRLTKGGRWKFRRRELEIWLEDRQARSSR